ncbi:MAG: DUF1638 domain-containing protein [Planctomycetota bacterium]|jgi:hypothetical protein
MAGRPRKRLKFIGCEIMYREACHLAAAAPHRVDLEFLRKGLHDLETQEMRSKIQAAVDAAAADGAYETILLGYARCNDGVVGTTARDVPLVIPKAHDCITFFFGSRAAYKRYFDEHPGTYYFTTGWAERGSKEGEYDQPAYGKQGVMAKLGLTEPYERLVEKYGRENADFIAQTLGDWTKNYSNMLYIEMGLCDESAFIQQAHLLADERGWSFEIKKGDWTLLEKLFFGDWDDDFVIVAPGKSIVARNDEHVLAAGP